MSFTDTSLPNVVLDTINYAYSKGVLMCDAAGNYNNAVKRYPAAYENVTTVATTNQNDQRCIPADWGTGSQKTVGRNIEDEIY